MNKYIVPENTITEKDISEWQNDSAEAKIIKKAILYPEGRLFVSRRTDNMMKPLEIFIPGVIRAKQRPRLNSKTKSVFTPAVTVNYENHIKSVFDKKYPDHICIDAWVPLELFMIANFIPPKSTSKKKRALMMDGFIKPTKKPDADNIIKNIDALNKIAFYDDSQIVDVRLVKKYHSIEGLYIKISEVAITQARIEL